MRLHIASMALSLAIFTRHVRTATAFTMRPLTSVRGFALGVGAVEGETETETAAKVNGEADVVRFPQKGKNVELAPPRMRFAPSPTGR